MKKYKYKGKTTNLGHHGKVEKGRTLYLTEEEAYLQMKTPNPDFAPLREPSPEGFPDSPGLPIKGPHFDLTSLAWGTSRVFKKVQKLRRTKLTQAICQLEACGFPVPKVDSRIDQGTMRDLILTIGRHAGWM